MNIYWHRRSRIMLALLLSLLLLGASFLMENVAADCVVLALIVSIHVAATDSTWRQGNRFLLAQLVLCASAQMALMVYELLG